MPDDAPTPHLALKMNTDDLDFELPDALIAQSPPAERTASRLMHYRRADARLEHCVFSELPQLLRGGDLLVFNDARVLPARFALRKSTGGLVDGLFLEEKRVGRWRVLLRNVGASAKGEFTVIGAPELAARIVRSGPSGEHELEVSSSESAARILDRIGRMPLPPYIRRALSDSLCQAFRCGCRTDRSPAFLGASVE
jgi:S-adenosylmethionine:tRNA ribosyltransferase-isomerase